MHYSEVYALQFSINSSEDNIKDASIILTNKEVLKDDKPVDGGLYDLHMGSVDHTAECQTCHYNKKHCPGHYGAIRMRYPLKSPHFRHLITKWLKIVCFQCGRLLVKDPPPASIPKDKWINYYVVPSKKVKTCPWPDCKADIYSIVLDKQVPTRILVCNKKDDNVKERQSELLNIQIRDIFDRIRDETVLRVGKDISSHPRKLILSTIRIPPTTMRPYNLSSSAKSNTNLVTEIFKLIQSNNLALPVDIAKVSEITPEQQDTFNVIDILYNEVVKGSSSTTNATRVAIPRKNNVPLSMSSTLSKKKGLIRGRLDGKKTHNVGRAVISCDSSIKLDEVGVPISMCRGFQIPVIVSPRNREQLMVYFMNARQQYPGCSGVTMNGSFHKIEYMDKSYKLKNGDVVWRDLIDGDPVLINRAPSLTFGSIGGHKVKVLYVGQTMRLNVASVSVYNADFDGDTMLLIILLRIMALCEVQYLSWMGNWMVSYQNSAPSYGAHQDSIVGAFILTSSKRKISRWRAMQMFSRIVTPHKLEFTQDWYTGRELVSMLLVPVNYPKRKTSMFLPQFNGIIEYEEDDKYVQFTRGKLVGGVLDKASLGSGVKGSLFHVIANEYGAKVALDSIYNIMQLVHNFLLYEGFTIGIRDVCMVKEETLKEIKANTQKLLDDADKITEQLDKNQLVPPIGMTISQFYEQQLIIALNPGDDFVIPIFKEIDIKTNRLMQMIMAGSKGKLTNAIVMSGAYGQTLVNGARAEQDFTYGRTSPYFERYSLSPRACGYIPTSYRDGIDADVFMFASKEARAGLVSNNLSTSITGEQSRIANKNLEAIVTDNLRKTVNGTQVLQPLFAENGIDVRKNEKIKFLHMAVSDKEFADHMRATTKHFPKVSQKDLDLEFEQLRIDRETFRYIQSKLEENSPKQHIFTSELLMPVNPFRIIEDVMDTNVDIQSTLDFGYLQERVQKLCIDIMYAYYNKHVNREKFKIPEHVAAATTFVQILVRQYLSARYLLNHKVGNTHLDIICDRILFKFKNSLSSHGQAVGIISAQSITALLTQYMLDSKHRTGGLGGTQTNVIVRFKEIIAGNKVTKTPQMQIYVLPEYQSDKMKVQEVANQLQMMTFSRYILRESILFEAPTQLRYPEFKSDIEIFKKMGKRNIDSAWPLIAYKWNIRFVLNAEQMVIDNVDLDSIMFVLKTKFPDLFFAYSPVPSANIVIRCFFTTTFPKGLNESIIIKKHLAPLRDTIIQGVEKITQTSVTEIPASMVDKDGAINSGKKIYIITTTGSNLRDVLMHPLVDPSRTQTNCIVEWEKMYGISSTRNKIIYEMRGILSSDDVLYEHSTIFADQMCVSGQMTGIQQTGMKVRAKEDVLVRAALKAPVPVFVEAAVEKIRDPINGITAPLMVGQAPLTGTLYNSFILNEKFIEGENSRSVNIEDEL